MISLVNGLGDVCGTNTITNLTDKRGTSAEGIDIGTIGTLTKGADDCLARNKHLIAILILADDTIGSNLLANVSGMSR